MNDRVRKALVLALVGLVYALVAVPAAAVVMTLLVSLTVGEANANGAAFFLPFLGIIPVTWAVWTGGFYVLRFTVQGWQRK